MDKIASFTVDHDRLLPGIYVSRIDGDVTTFDLRTRQPNCGNYMDCATMHTFEHMFATYVRNSPIKNDVIYFGPMGCQTGFYLLVRNADPPRVLQIVKEVLGKIISHEGEVFGKSPAECGNYKTLHLPAAKTECARYLAVLDNLNNCDFKYE
ncbi:MAG: S-ribosylhomocysteine lyase [Christensenellales bacterium]